MNKYPLRLLSLALLLATFANVAWADFEAGRRAANRGDFDQALAEWKPLADAGDSEAQFSIGRMYALGDGVPKNYALAKEWFVKASDKGHARARFSLGLMYERGDGVAKDDTKARSWYELSSAAGFRDADAKLSALSKKAEAARATPTPKPRPTPIVESTEPSPDFRITTTADQTPAVVTVATVQPTATSASVPNTGGLCLYNKRSFPSQITWFDVFSPDDTVFEAFCKLADLQGLDRNAGRQGDDLLPPYQRNLAQVLQEVSNRWACAPLSDWVIDVPLTSDKQVLPVCRVGSSVWVGKVSLGFIPFDFSLEFEEPDKLALLHLYGKRPAPSIPAEVKGKIIPARLVGVTLESEGPEVASLGDTMVESLRRKYPTAKIEELSSLAKGEQDALIRLRADSEERALEPISKGQLEALEQRASRPYLRISDGGLQVVIKRRDEWIKISYGYTDEFAQTRNKAIEDEYRALMDELRSK